MTRDEAQQKIEAVLTVQMPEGLRTVEYALPAFDVEPSPVTLAEAARAHVAFRHVRGASDCTYLVQAFGDELLMQFQLNVFRLVVVYRVPAVGPHDAATLGSRLARWRIGAEHAGWKIGFRDAISPREPNEPYVEAYCYAMAAADFLEDELQQMFWRTDIVQMTRYFMLEMIRSGIRLSPRAAGFRV